MFHTLAGILEENEPAPSFSQLVHEHLSLLSEEFECYFPTTEDPRTAKEWIRNSFVNKPGESSMLMCEEDQLLEITNDRGLLTFVRDINSAVVLDESHGRIPRDRHNTTENPVAISNIVSV